MYVRKTLGDTPVPNIAQQFIQMHGNTQINPNARIEDAVNSAGSGVMCAQVMKTCPDGSQVGYDTKVKDRCAYLPCPGAASSSSNITVSAMGPMDTLTTAFGILNPENWKGSARALGMPIYVLGPLAWAAIGLGAYMLFKK